MIDGYVHTIHADSVSVKNQDEHTALVYGFLGIATGKQQEIADLVGVDRSMVSVWKRQKRDGEPIFLQDTTAERMEDAVRRLRGSDPYAEAYRKGVRDARAVIDDAVRRLDSLDATEPLGKSDSAKADHSRQRAGDAQKAKKGRGPKTRRGGG